MSVKIPDIPLAPIGYDLIGKKIMIHDLSQPNTSFTKLIDATDLGGGGSGTGNPLEIVTYQEATDLATQDLLVPGQKYLITDADINLYGGTQVFVSAATTATFEIKGHGVFFNPDYQNIPIWSPFSELIVSNEFDNILVGETITNQVGDTGEVYAYNPQIKKIFFLILSGSWVSSTSITGASSGYTADIDFASIMNYPVGTKVAWGGKVWENINGVYGSTLDFFTLDDNEWIELDFSDPSYIGSIDVVTYDFANDEIKYREDIFLNKVHTNMGIRNFPWGNSYVLNNTMLGGNVELINYLGKDMTSNFFGESCSITSPFILGDSGFKNCKFECFNSDSMFMTDCILSDVYINANNIFLSSAVYQNSPIEMRMTNSELILKMTITFDGTRGFGEQGLVATPQITIPSGFYLSQLLVKVVDLVCSTSSVTEVNLDLNGTPGSGLQNPENVIDALNTASTTIINASSVLETTNSDYLKMEIRAGDVTDGSITFIAKFVCVNHFV